MARFLWFSDIADRVPTAGLEVGQTDFKDLGYSYDTVELVMEGIRQGFSWEELAKHSQIQKYVKNDTKIYACGRPKFNTAEEVVHDIQRRNSIAVKKSEIIHPPTAKITLEYKKP